MFKEEENRISSGPKGVGSLSAASCSVVSLGRSQRENVGTE